MISKQSLARKIEAHSANGTAIESLSDDVLTQISGGLLSGPKHADSHSDTHHDTVSNDG